MQSSAVVHQHSNRPAVISQAILRHAWRAASVVLLLLASVSLVYAQAGAVNGAIEGSIVDASGAVLPGVTVTISNNDTGAQRVVVTNERGVYRAPLLPLGTYQLVADLEGFKKYEQTGILLTAGQDGGRQYRADGRPAERDRDRHRRGGTGRSRQD